VSEQRDAARQFVIETCLSLAVDEETSFDKNVVRTGFPTAIGGRLSEDQILDSLPGSNYGAFLCRRDLATGDYIVSRQEPSEALIRRG
jgi:hypothetical protein